MTANALSLRFYGMRRHHQPWFRDGDRYERECAAVQSRTVVLAPIPPEAKSLSDLLFDARPGEAIFLGMTRTTYPKLRANVFPPSPPFTEADFRRGAGLDP